MEQLELLTAWRDPLIRTGQVLLIIFLAWFAQRILTRAISRLGDRYSLLPPEVLQPLRVPGALADHGQRAAHGA